MIYIVDEDIAQVEPLKIELTMRGHCVTVLRNADVAYEKLLECRQADLVIIDIMLAVRDGAQGSRFDIERTEGYLTTGIHFLEDLCKMNSALFPSRAAILTQTSKPKVLAKIKATCNLYGIPFWRKISFDSVFELADSVEQHIKNVGTVSP